MRLIDADKLPMYEVYKDDIDAAPTVDAEVVRHGRWVRTTTNPGIKSCYGYVHDACSFCGSEDLFIPKYCSNCGAKMDLQEGETNDQAGQ